MEIRHQVDIFALNDFDSSAWSDSQDWIPHCKFYIIHCTIYTKCFVLCRNTLTCLNCLIQRTLGWIPHCYSSRRLSVSFNCTDSHYTASSTYNASIAYQCTMHRGLSKNNVSPLINVQHIRLQCIMACQLTIYLTVHQRTAHPNRILMSCATK